MAVHTETASRRQYPLSRLLQWFHWTIFPVIIAIIGHAVLGANFYKRQLAGIYATEWLLLFGCFCLGIYWLARRHVPRVQVIPWLLVLMLVYFAGSLVTDRDLYWVLRHSVLLLYTSIALWGWLYAQWVDRFNGGDDSHLFRMLAVLGIATYIVQRLNLIPDAGHALFASFNIMLVGLSWWVLSASKQSDRVLRGILIFGLVLVLEVTTARHLMALAIIPMTFYIFHPRLRAMLLVIVIVAVPAAVWNIHGFTDGNAQWRYIYWSALIQESINYSFGALGQGFGVPHTPPNIATDLWPVIDRDSRPLEYQMLSAQPHNGLLLLLKQLGLPAVLLFLLPFYHALKKLGFRKVDRQLAPWLMAITVLLVISMSFPMLSTPFTAVFFFWCYGGFVFQVYRPKTPTEIGRKIEYRQPLVE